MFRQQKLEKPTLAPVRLSSKLRLRLDEELNQLGSSNWFIRRGRVTQLGVRFLLHLIHAHASNARAVMAKEVLTTGAWLHMSSSQKHMWPVPVLSIMQTWSTMNRFIWSWEVHVRRTTSYAGMNERVKLENIIDQAQRHTYKS